MTFCPLAPPAGKQQQELVNFYERKFCLHNSLGMFSFFCPALERVTTTLHCHCSRPKMKQELWFLAACCLHELFVPYLTLWHDLISELKRLLCCSVWFDCTGRSRERNTSQPHCHLQTARTFPSASVATTQHRRTRALGHRCHVREQEAGKSYNRRTWTDVITSPQKHSHFFTTTLTSCVSQCDNRSPEVCLCKICSYTLMKNLLIYLFRWFEFGLCRCI